MKNNLLFDFRVNKENKSIHVVREFDAPVILIWKAWTQAELLEQWWAPEPWKAETKKMDFREGGQWHYAMVGPEGEKHWALVQFLSIQEEKSFTANDAFSDEKGNINQDLPQNRWLNQFIPQGNQTRVEIELSFDNLADLEKIIEMGFKEGFTMGLNQLEQLLGTLK